MRTPLCSLTEAPGLPRPGSCVSPPLAAWRTGFHPPPHQPSPGGPGISLRLAASTPHRISLRLAARLPPCPHRSLTLPATPPQGGSDWRYKPGTSEPFAKFGSALGQPWVSPWERGRPARILVKALPRRQSAGEPTNPVKPIATTLPSLVRAGRPRSQGSQPFPAINPTYWRILQKAHPLHNKPGTWFTPC